MDPVGLTSMAQNNTPLAEYSASLLILTDTIFRGSEFMILADSQDFLAFFMINEKRQTTNDKRQTTNDKRQTNINTQLGNDPAQFK